MTVGSIIVSIVVVIYVTRFVLRIWSSYRVTFKILTPWVSLVDLDIKLSPRDLRLLEWKLYIKSRNTVSLYVSSDAYIELNTLFSYAAYHGAYNESRIFTAPIDKVFGSTAINKLRDNINDGIKSHKFVLVGIKQKKSRYALPKMKMDDEMKKDVEDVQKAVITEIEYINNESSANQKKPLPIHVIASGSKSDIISKYELERTDKDTEDRAELKRKIEFMHSMKSTFND